MKRWVYKHDVAGRYRAYNRALHTCESHTEKKQSHHESHGELSTNKLHQLLYIWGQGPSLPALEFKGYAYLLIAECLLCARCSFHMLTHLVLTTTLMCCYYFYFPIYFWKLSHREVMCPRSPLVSEGARIKNQAA